MGQKWMQRELPYRQGYTNLDLNRGKGPHVVGDFKNTPFRSDWFDLILFDPPWLTDHRPGRAQHPGDIAKHYEHFRVSLKMGNDYGHAWPGKTNFEVWFSAEERNLGVMRVFFEISHLLRSGGVCVFKWGSGSGMDIEKILRYRPASLEILKIHKRKSKGGAKEITWHAILQKR